MKRFPIFVSALTVVLLILSACGGGAASTFVPTDVPATEPEASASPTEPPAGATDTPTTAPIDIAGPPMTVGSTYIYIDGSVLVAVPGGPFIMGHGGQDNPEHEVNVSDFWIYQTEVTNQMYSYCVAVGKCSSPDPKDNPNFGKTEYLNHPVVGVNYEQAAAYCEFVNGRLPTEAEWEKTARGPEGNIYPWGDAAPTCDLLNTADCIKKTTEITKYPQGKSYYDAVDLAGNVYEWVADWYDPTYYGESPVDDPLGPEFGTRRSVRSSGFGSSFFEAEAARRSSLQPLDHRGDLGFRCVVEDPTEFAPFCQTVAYYGGSPGPGSQGNVPGLKCPTVNITQNQYSCSGQTSGQTSTNVIFESTDPGAVIGGVGGCTELAPPFPAKYKCDPPTAVTATIQAWCTWTDPGPATCAPHYNLDPATGICVWDGSGTPGTLCPVGATYNPASQCCSFDPGTAMDYPLCPAGYTAVENPPGVFKCLPGGGPFSVSDSEVVSYLTCYPPGGGGQSCQPQSCSYKASWDSQKCCCVNMYTGQCE